jgi:hypothetical protein
MTSAKRARLSVAFAAWVLALVILPSAAGAARIALGVFVPDTFDHPGLVRKYGEQVGRQPTIVLAYKNWSIEPFYPPELDRVWKGGAVPMITWEPQKADLSGIPQRDIASGRYDRYIRQSAEAAAAWGHPIFVRFAQEMNGDWFPWGAGVEGNTARDYRQAWHHIFYVFRNHGADNVRWVWSPNEDAGGGHPLSVFYPGDEFVDWLAIDGFCWGGTLGWPSFTTIFGSTYDRLAKLTTKPMMVAETGAGEEGGDKAEWISSTFEREAPAFPRLRALVWFDGEDSHADLRVNSSPAALRAFQSAIAAPRYGVTRRELLATPAQLPAGGPAPSPPGGGYGAPSFLEELRIKLHGKYLVAAILVGAVLIGLAALIAVAVARRVRKGGRRTRARLAP